MSKLEELIQKLCPNGVEQESIKNICKKICSGGTPKSSVREYYGGNIPWLRTQEVNFRDIFDTDIKITELGYNKSSAKLIPVNCVIVAMYGATAGKVAINKIELTTNQACCNLEIDDTKALYRYVYHFLCSRYEYIKSLGQGSQNNINANIVKELKIPIPPLEIQREIVGILDKFTDLTADLTAELTAELISRKKQYQYYLNHYFESQLDNLVSLDSLGTLTRGKRFVHADAIGQGVPCIHYGELYTYYGVYASNVKSHIREELRPKMRYAHKGDVIIVGAGENNIDIGIGVAWEGDEDVAVHDACYILCHSQNSKYISYFLRSDMYHNQIKKYVSEGKICSISAKGLGKAMIPLPSIAEQQKIVEILDRFDALCNDLTNGLSAEIEARQKQYEYYRDKLLSFK